MFRILISAFFLFVFPLHLISQILPKEGSSLTHRLIGFSFPSQEKVTNYKLEIAAGYNVTEDSFRNNIIKTLSGKEAKIIAEAPSFGSQYTWRTTSIINNITTKSDLHHFSTLAIPDVMRSTTRFRILQPAIKYNDAYVFLDGNKGLYDMNGQPIWYLPALGGINDENVRIRDMKMSPMGTITLMLSEFPYEINLNGDILWKGPDNGLVSGDTTEHYHHEFTRLSNGHYMVLGIEFVSWDRDQLSSTDSHSQQVPGPQLKKKINDTPGPKTPFGTIIEYDEKGNVFWSWKSSHYFMTSDFIYFRDSKPVVDAHDNSFFFDEAAKIIYINYKNISRILKVKYPEGTVMNTYGEIFKPGIPVKGNGLYCGPHAIKYSQPGRIFLFNNNLCNFGYPPRIMILKEPLSDKGNLKKEWDYECTVEDSYSKGAPTGGNVLELPDRSIFVAMGGAYSKIFIVSRDKKILWSALPEMWYPEKQLWYPVIQYRASIITRKDLERLVWNSELYNR